MIQIASIPANISVIEEYLQGVFETYQLDRKIYPNVLVSITEAVNNAMIHGNGLDQRKFVKLKSECCKNCLKIKVSDEGKGFDPSTLPDPTLPENLERCGGRGVFLMQRLSDKVVFLNNGRTVEIEFQLD